MENVLNCIIYKLKTGCQWSCLFIDLEGFESPFSYQTVYYFFNKWSKVGVFERAFLQIQKQQKANLSLNLLHLDGTQTLAQEIYQGRKRARTSNLLVLVDEKGLPLAFGDILSGNHHDLFEVVPQFSKMCQMLKTNEVKLEQATLNMDKGFDSQGIDEQFKEEK